MRTGAILLVIPARVAGARAGIPKVLPGRANKDQYSSRQPRARMTEQTFGMNSVVTIFRNDQQASFLHLVLLPLAMKVTEEKDEGLFNRELRRILGRRRNPSLDCQRQLEFDGFGHFAYLVTASQKAKYSIKVMKPRFNRRA
jgi:hypothetical protein